jgi:SagB-type dehydrogenase family enzyme
MALHLHLKQGAEVLREGDDLLLCDQGGRCRRFSTPSGLLMQMLQRLAAQGATLVDLIHGCSSLAEFLTLQELEQRGWIAISLIASHGSLLTLQPQTIALKRQHPPSGLVQVQWSQYLQIMPQMDGIQLEVPLQGSRLFLHDKRLTSLLWDLSAPQDWDSLARTLPQDIQDQRQDLLMLLLSAGVVGVMESDDVLSCDRRPERQRWSKEDLNLHHRSRWGWQHQCIGGTYPGAEVEPCPPLLNQASFLEALELPRPVPGEPDPGFFDVLERRSSRRNRRIALPSSVTLDQLGRLLWATLRIRQIYPVQQGTVHPCAEPYEVASRPVASFGGMQEIDAYLLVRRCEGLICGLYRYDPLDHQLLRIDELNASCIGLLEGASKTGFYSTHQQPDILFVFAARYSRLSWMHEGLPYALMLKNVGVIMQQFYLVATALELAACGLSSGDSALFARATHLDPFSDVPVGEFMISAAYDSDFGSILA